MEQDEDMIELYAVGNSTGFYYVTIPRDWIIGNMISINKERAEALIDVLGMVK